MSSTTPINSDESFPRYERFDSQDAMYENCPAEELREFAGLAEHPGETEQRLRAAAEWDGPGGARQFFEAELGLHLSSGDPRRRENARRLAFELIQQCPQWQPPADAVGVPTIFEQRQRESEESGGGGFDGQDSGSDAEKGCRPPRLTEEEKEHFRKIDDEFRSGLRRQDPLEDIDWVYRHIDDDDVTALDAPSRGAWSSLFYARFNRVQFFTSTWPNAAKELMKRHSGPTPGQPGTETQMSHDELADMIAAGVEESKGTFAEM